MKVQQLQQSVMPAGAQTAGGDYRVNTVDFAPVGATSAPLRRGASDMAAAAESLSGTMAKVQEHKDRLGATDITGMLNAELSNFQTTLDDKNDGQRIEMIREATMRRIDANNLISERARRELTARAGYALEQFAVSNNRKREAMIVRQNIANAQQKMGEAIAAGDVEEAMKNRDYLEQQGLPVPSRRKIGSLGVLGEWDNRLQTMSHQEMTAELDDVLETLRGGKTVERLDKEDSRKLADLLKKNMQIRQSEDYDKYSRMFQDGKLSYDKLMEESAGAKVAYPVFFALQSQFRRDAKTRIVDECNAVILGQQSGETTRETADGKIKELQLDLKRMAESGEIDPKEYTGLNNALRERDMQGVMSEQRRQKQIAEAQYSDADYRIGIELAWPGSATGREEMYNRELERIISNRELTQAQKRKLQKELQHEKQQADSPEKGYRNTPVYQYGKDYIDRMAERGDIFISEPGFFWGVNKNKSKDTVKTVKGMMLRSLDYYMRGNPGATQREVDQFLETTRTGFNKTMVDELARKAFTVNTTAGEASSASGEASSASGEASSNGNPVVNILKSNEVRRILPDGRVAIFDKSDNFLRLE